MKPFITLIFLLIAVHAYAQSGSLMGDSEFGTEEGMPMTLRNGSFAYQPVPEPRIFKEQDLITVLVSVTDIYTNNSDFQRQRKIKSKMGLTDWVRFPGFTKLPEPIETDPPKVGLEIDSQTRAKGQLTNTEKMMFKITCRVAWKMDNGNLHIEGQDQRIYGEEGKSIYFSGDIRPEDVKPDNTITSGQVAMPVIRVIPSGNVFDSTKRQYGSRFLDHWKPF